MGEAVRDGTKDGIDSQLVAFPRHEARGVGGDEQVTEHKAGHIVRRGVTGVAVGGGTCDEAEI